MMLQATGKHVIVRKIRENTRTEAGLYLPGNEQKYLLEGQVESCGDEVSPCIQVGDRVILDRYMGTNLTNDLISYREEDILAVIEGDSDAGY